MSKLRSWLNPESIDMSRTVSKPVDPEYRQMAIAAARLRSEGKNQKQIAERLGKSQPEVSRMLGYAEDEGFLAKAPSFLEHKLTPKELREVDRRFFVNEQLREKLLALAPPGLHLNVQVLPGGDAEFAAGAAGCVARLLKRTRLTGVMWGRTLQRILERIGDHRAFFDEGGPCKAQCIPLCGDPVHLMNLGQAKYSASYVAAGLNLAINPGSATDQPCLVGVPAYLSARLFQQRASGSLNWSDFVEDIPGYRRIFGANHDKEKPLVESLDAILTGMGVVVKSRHAEQTTDKVEPTAAHEEMADFIRERVIQEKERGITPEVMKRLVYGDIGGWLIERPGLKAADQRLVESLNQGWTGVKDVHFMTVARNARPDGMPGVILVAAGAAKAEMLKELVRRGFVNEILIDTSLAAALSQ